MTRLVNGALRVFEVVLLVAVVLGLGLAGALTIFMGVAWALS